MACMRLGVLGLGFRVGGRVWGLGFRVEDLGFRVEGVRCKCTMSCFSSRTSSLADFKPI